MGEPMFAKLLEACGLKPVDLDGETLAFGGFRFTPGEDPSMEITMSEKVAALVKRAVDDERRRCMEIAERGEAWARAAYLASAEAGDRSATRAFVVQCDGFAKIARLIGEELE